MPLPKAEQTRGVGHCTTAGRSAGRGWAERRAASARSCCVARAPSRADSASATLPRARLTGLRGTSRRRPVVSGISKTSWINSTASSDASWTMTSTPCSELGKEVSRRTTNAMSSRPLVGRNRTSILARRVDGSEIDSNATWFEHVHRHRSRCLKSTLRTPSRVASRTAQHCDLVRVLGSEEQTDADEEYLGEHHEMVASSDLAAGVHCRTKRS